MKKSVAEPKQAGNRNSPPCQIEKLDSPADILEWFPSTAAVLRAYGLRAVLSPFFSQLARYVSLEQLCGLLKIDIDELLLDLNQAAGLTKQTKTCQGCCGGCDDSRDQ